MAKKKTDTTKILCVSNQKGGVGKTTITVQTAMHRAEQGYKILVLDFDPQGNTSECLTRFVSDAAKDAATQNYELFLPELKEISPISCRDNIDLIFTPAHDNNLMDVDRLEHEYIVNPKRNLEKILYDYDYVIIDCPPGLGLKLVTALSIATHVVCPVCLSGFAVSGIEGLLNTIYSIKEELNPDLKIVGFVINKLDKRSVTHREAVDDLRQAAHGMVLKNVIHIRTPIDTANSMGISLKELTYAHVAHREVSNVSDEIFERVDG